MRNHLAREGIEDPDFEFVAEPKIDGLAISLHLPRRRVRARRDPRQRRGRRGRHPQPAHDRIDPAAAGHGRPAGAARGARRGVHVAAGLRGAERAPRRGRAVDVHEPAQLGRRDDPPARSEARRRPAAVAVVLRDRRHRGARLRRALGGAASGCARTASRSIPTSRSSHTEDEVVAQCRVLGAAARLARLRDRRRRGQGQPVRAAAPARRRRPRPALGDRLEVPADDGGHAGSTRSAGTPASSATCTPTRCSSRSTSPG